jgi:hypothetical protein
MTWLRSIAGEIFGLFVDDGSFAGAILAWIVVAGFALPRLGLADAGKALILFAGLAAILLTGAIRRARR